MPVIVAAGYVVGYGVGPHVERILRTLGPVEYVVLTVTVVAAGEPAGRTPYRTFFSCEPCGLPDEVEGGDGATPAPAGLFTRSRVGSSTKVA
jgi:hypothetical protein